MSISKTQIEYVIALEQTGNFSKAADKCYVTQSTLSTMIKKLENEINIVLFDRKSKPIALTKEGISLLPQFKIIKKEYELLEEQIQARTKHFHGTFRIGIIPTLAPFLLPLFLNEMILKYPDVNFEIHEITTTEIINLIKQRDLDIGILSLPINDEELIEKTLFHEDFLVYDTHSVNQTHRKKSYKVNEIDANRLWLLEESHCLSLQIENICQLKNKERINNNLVYKSGSILSLLELVNTNKGITLLPRLATHNSSVVNKEHLYPFHNPKPVRSIGFITHPNFAKYKLMEILEKQILKTVRPLLKKLNNIKVINPK